MHRDSSIRYLSPLVITIRKATERLRSSDGGSYPRLIFLQPCPSDWSPPLHQIRILFLAAHALLLLQLDIQSQPADFVAEHVEADTGVPASSVLVPFTMLS